MLSFESNHTILFTRKTLTSAHASIIPEFKEKIELTEKADQFEVTKFDIHNKYSGSNIIFKGLSSGSNDNTANLKSIHNVSTYVLDEAEELTDEATFDKIDFSIRNQKVQNRIVIILNPTTKAHWIYKRFFESLGVAEGFNGTIADTTYIHTSYLDNIRNLSDTFLQRVAQLAINDPFKYNHVIMGGWLDKADGVIFKNWTHGAFDTSLPYGYGLDFGFFPDPDALVKVAVDNKNKILYIHEEFYLNELPTHELANRVKSIVGNKQVVADSAGKRSIEDIKRSGVNIQKVDKYAGSVLDGINTLRNYQLVITPESTNIAKELNNYSEKNGNPIDSYNHAIDAIRYAVQHLTNQTKRSNPKMIC
jgi:phage terminase large subunit